MICTTNYVSKQGYYSTFVYRHTDTCLEHTFADNPSSTCEVSDWTLRTEPKTAYHSLDNGDTYQCLPSGKQT